MYYGIETARPKIEVRHTQFLAMTTKGVYMHLSELRFCTCTDSLNSVVMLTYLKLIDD